MTYLAQAADIAQAEFERGLAACGVNATWKQRTTNDAGTSGRIGQAARQNDPNDADWVRDVDDTNLYTTKRTIKIWFNASTSRQEVSAGQVLTGSTMGWVKLSDEVRAGDILIVDGVLWYVDGAQPPTPPIHRELTLRRK